MSKVKIPFIAHIMMSYMLKRFYIFLFFISFSAFDTCKDIHFSAYPIPQNNA